LTLTDEVGTTFYTATYSNGDVYNWNICGTVTSSFCTTKTGCAVCQSAGGSQNSCGLFSTQLWAPATNGTDVVATVTYSGGDICTGQNGQPARKAIINMVCTDDAEGNTVVSEVVCVYTLQMATDAACSGGVNVGWVGFSIILAVILLFVLYLVIGVIIKWKKYEATGIDLIPNVEFWKDVPFLFKDGWVFVINKVTCGKVCGGYSSI